MAISGVNGSQGPQESNNNLPVKKNDKQDNTAEIDKKIREYFNSAASMENNKNVIDTEKESTFFDNAINTLKTQFPVAANIIDNIVDKLTGGNNAKETAVTDATNSPVQNEESTNFDKTGNVIPDIETNSDGTTYTKFNGDNVQGTPDSVRVTGPDGESVGGTRVFPGGIQILEQPDGSIGVFRDGELIVGDEARAIIDSLNINLKNN